ncbi:MAG: hypothetical protein QNK04_06150 [Myxococcota bacterium]|nr:hypothetical protein [Myxococcota bacterium]
MFLLQHMTPVATGTSPVAHPFALVWREKQPAAAVRAIRASQAGFNRVEDPM